MEKRRVMATNMAILGMVLLNIASCTPKNGIDGHPAKCRTAIQLQQLMEKRGDLIDESEYEILETYGKPPFVSMNSRSEKLYYYQPCDSGAATVIVRFSGIGRVKEVYLKEE